MPVAVDPFPSLPPLVVCAYREYGRASDPDAAVPAVQISSAPIESQAWEWLSIERAIESGRLRQFEEVDDPGVRGGQYVDANVAVLWVDRPSLKVRYQIWINYGSTEERPAAHVALMTLQALGELVLQP